MDVVIRPLEPGDTVTGFSLGDAKYLALKTYLKKHAKKYHQECLGFTYCVFPKGNKAPMAYITLLCGEVVTDNSGLVPDEIEYRYKTYPAVKIARLAVHSDHRTRKLGLQLVSMALGIAKLQISKHVGCRFVMVDSKKEAVGFYEKCGFTILDTDANKRRSSPVMFLDLLKT